MVWHPAHDGRGVLAFGAAVRALGIPFAHIMEGRKGESSRELVVYDLDQRRLIDAEITRRTVDFYEAQRSLGQSVLRLRPIHSSPLPDAAESEVCRHDGTTSPTRSPRWMRMLARYSMGSMNSASATTPSSCSPATTVRKRPGPGRDHPAVARLLLHAHGRLAARAFIIRWPGRIPAGRAATRSCIRSTPTRRSPRSQAPRCPRPSDRRRGPERFPAWQVRTIQARRFPRVRGGSAGSGEVAELENRLLRRAAGLVEPACQARHSQSIRSHHRSEGGVPRNWTWNTWNAGPAIKIVTTFEQSLKKYPPIAPGTPDPYAPPQ